MANKTVLLPRELNTEAPPETNSDVLVLLSDGSLRVLFYEDGKWIEPDSQECYFYDCDSEEIKGWCHIVKQ